MPGPTCGEDMRIILIVGTYNSNNNVTVARILTENNSSNYIIEAFFVC